MSVIQKLLDAEENKDLDKFNKVMSEDFVWIKHSTGEQINWGGIKNKAHTGFLLYSINRCWAGNQWYLSLWQKNKI